MAEGTPALIEFDGGALSADMLADATAELTSELTLFAIESGASINDHAIIQPRRVTLTLVQTETPITAVPGFAQIQQELSYRARARATETVEVQVPQKEFRPTSLLALTAGVQQALFGQSSLRFTGSKANAALTEAPLKITVLASNSDVSRVNEFHTALIALLETVTLVQITVKQQAYPDMVVVGVSRQDAAGQVGAARFTVTLQQVSTAETQTVELPPVPADTKAKNAGKNDGIKYDAQFGPPPPPATQLLDNLVETGVMKR